MLLAELPKMLYRRWYLALVALVATACLVGWAYVKAPATYTATAEVLLLPPASSVPTGGNPYLNLDGLNVAGDVVAKRMSDDATSAALKGSGAVGEYRVAPDSAAAAPMILLTSETADAAASMRTVGLLIERLPTVLSDVQALAGVPPGAYITSTVLTRSDKPVVSLKPVIRTASMAAVGGVVISLLVIALIDTFLLRRRGRAAAAGEDVATPELASKPPRTDLASDDGNGLGSKVATDPSPDDDVKNHPEEASALSASLH